MTTLSRVLRRAQPMMRGDDVLEVQRRLRQAGFLAAGDLDGVFGPGMETAVKAFQTARGLTVDGVVGPGTFQALGDDRSGSPAPNAGTATPAPAPAPASGIDLGALVAEQCRPHRVFPDSVEWRLTPTGVAIGDEPARGSGGAPTTARRVWTDFRESITRWATTYQVPVELIIATICTESQGKPGALREEPGFISDAETPHRVSPGLMQVLISTARETLKMPDIDRAWLFEPDNAIRSGTAYIARQRNKSRFDPPAVACAYNAGSLRLDSSTANRWRMLQYPLHTSHHADRFVGFFNDCFVVFADDPPDAPSFVTLLKKAAVSG